MARDRRRFLLESAFASAALLHPGLRSFAAIPEKKANPFLDGNFAPVREEFTTDDLKVIGAIPKELQGMFVRNGPNPQFDPIGRYHWFDGDGMLHGVQLRDGKASYRNRFIQTEKYTQEKKAGKALFTGILEMPDLKKIAKGDNPFMVPANTALVHHNAKLLALYEVGTPYEVKVPDLSTVGEYTFNKKLQHAFTAHPKIDPVTGEMVAFGYSAQPNVMMSLINAKGELTKTVKVPLDRPAMIHDFAITKNYAVFPVCPQTFDMKRMIQGQSPWYFDKDKPTTWVLVPRTGEGKPLRIEAKTCFTFHLLNAYEAGDEIVVIGCRYSRFPGAVSFGEADDAKTPNPSVPYRWTLNLKTGTVAEVALDTNATEFPRHNEQRLGSELKYGYFGTGDGEFFAGLSKYDLKTGKSTQHLYGEGRFGGEGVFVARPNAKLEDEGWLLNYVFDKASDKSELVIADAQDMTAKPVARILLPTRVPYGFHGTWVPV